MPKSSSTLSVSAFANGTFVSATPSSGCSASVVAAGARTDDCGAWAARAKTSMTSPAESGSGSVRLKARPSRSSRWAMWSIALTTKSTGTMLISRPSTPGIGIQAGHDLADPPDQLEEVVGTVDLVHLAGLGVADDDSRPVDAPRALALLADDALGLVLGPEVGIDVEVLGLVEHVLAPGPLVEAGAGDRADHVDAARLDGLGELDHVPGALDVRDPLRLGVGVHVVDGGEMEEVIDVPRQLLDVLLGDAEPTLREVADDPDDPLLVDAPAVAELGEAALRPLADEHVDRPLALEQQLDEVTADESGRAGDEIAHLSFLRSRENPGGPYTLHPDRRRWDAVLERPAEREYARP